MCLCAYAAREEQSSKDTQFDINSDTVLARHDAAKDTSNNERVQMDLSMAVLYKRL